MPTLCAWCRKCHPNIFANLKPFAFDLDECPYIPIPKPRNFVPMDQMVVDHQWLQWHLMLQKKFLTLKRFGIQWVHTSHNTLTPSKKICWIILGTSVGLIGVWHGRPQHGYPLFKGDDEFHALCSILFHNLEFFLNNNQIWPTFISLQCLIFHMLMLKLKCP